MTTNRRTRRSWPSIVGAAIGLSVLIVAVGAVGYRLGQRTLDARPTDPLPAAPTTVIAVEGTLIDARPVSVEAEWQPDGEVLNRLPGTITWAAASRGSLFEISAGSVLYSVDETRVVAVPGDVPAYRDMGPGLVGSDIAQLQQYLLAQGFRISVPDGSWRGSTTTAYRDWRAANLLPPSDTVRLGEIVFLADLPLRTATSQALVVGGMVEDGDALFASLGDSPTLALSLPRDSSIQLEAGADVQVDVAGTTVTAVTVDRQTPSDDGNVRVTLELVGASRGCDVWCGNIPTSGASTWAGTVVLAGPATGVIVPVGALRSGANGKPTLVTVNGETGDVEVVLQVGGRAIVEGVESGAEIVLPTAAPL